MIIYSIFVCRTNKSPCVWIARVPWIPTYWFFRYPMEMTKKNPNPDPARDLSLPPEIYLPRSIPFCLSMQILHLIRTTVMGCFMNPTGS